MRALRPLPVRVSLAGTAALAVGVGFWTQHTDPYWPTEPLERAPLWPVTGPTIPANILESSWVLAGRDTGALPGALVSKSRWPSERGDPWAAQLARWIADDVVHALATLDDGQGGPVTAFGRGDRSVAVRAERLEVSVEPLPGAALELIRCELVAVGEPDAVRALVAAVAGTSYLILESAEVHEHKTDARVMLRFRGYQAPG